jgi:tRNA(fMet)-specific endonuclease VapC
MTLYVLDTNMLSLYQAGHPVVVRRVQQCPPAQLAATVISVDEILTGWYTKVRKAKKRDQLARAYQHLADSLAFLCCFRILPFPEPAIARYEELRASLRRVGKNDLRIAAITRENGGTAVTQNTRDFQQVPGLPVEDWSK